MTDIGELVVRIKADASQMQQQMQQATSTVKQSSDQMTSALGEVKGMLGEFGIALSVGALVEFTKSSLEAANNLYIMGQRTGFATDTLSKLNIPLLQNGSSIDEFSNSMKFLSRNIEMASEGNPMLIKAFNDLGLSVTKLKALSPEQQFYAVANAMSQVTDQGKFTADGMAIMGRGFASIAPLIKASAGNMKDFVGQMDGLTKEEIAKVHEIDDKWISFWQHMKIGAVEGLLAVRDFIRSAGPGLGANSPISVTKPVTLTNEQAAQSVRDSMKAAGIGDAKGNNNDVSSAKAQANEVQDYITSLRGEATALGQSKLSLEVYKAEKEAASKALTDYNNGLRTSKELTDQEKISIAGSVVAYDEKKQALEKLQKAEEEEIHMQAQLKAEISSALAQGIQDYRNFGSAVKNVLQQVMKQIIEMQITTPLVNSIGGLFGSAAGNLNFTNIGAYLGLNSPVGPPMPAGFAAGGSPPIGVPSIVGENGPELFVPQQAGTVIPNNRIGGNNVTVQNTFIMQPGLSETVNAAVMRSAPAIVQASHDSVIAALQKGGNDSKIARLRA